MSRTPPVALAAVLAATAALAQVSLEPRTLTAVRHPDGEDTTLPLVGGPLAASARGKAMVERKDGRTQVRLRLEALPSPQSIGPLYTAFVVWAVSPEGRPENLGNVPPGRRGDVRLTTGLQNFALLVTAEPHAAVRQPGPMVVAVNGRPEDPDDDVLAGTVQLVPQAPPALSGGEPDYRTPLPILGARRAVQIARLEGASEYADRELRDAEIKLGALDQVLALKDRDDAPGDEVLALAQDVMRLAEQARTLGHDRRAEARLAAERRAARESLEQARSDAEDAARRARLEREAAEEARREAEAAREALLRAEQETEAARQRAALAQGDAERARAEAEAERRRQDELRERLYQSLSAILEVRREARGLIVNLSDVLFDFNKATLTPGAREKLAKLAGILLAYPAPYQVEIEGHTDSVGSDEYNLRLSRERAESVRAYVVGAGLSAERIVGTRGLGEARPVASNDTPAGRQQNRRVEIVIGESGGVAQRE